MSKLSVALALILSAVVAAPALAARIPVDAKLMALINPDGDGTVDLKEAQSAGAKKFKQLDTDSDGTLDAKELSGLVTADELKAADPDNDGTLDLKEYEALIEKRFNTANPDDDGTLDEAELETPAGQSLLGLIA